MASVGPKLALAGELVAAELTGDGEEGFGASLVKAMPRESRTLLSLATQEAMLEWSTNLAASGLREMLALTPLSLYQEVFHFVVASRDPQNKEYAGFSLRKLRDHLTSVFGTEQLQRLEYKIVHEYVATAKEQCDKLNTHWQVLSRTRPPLGTGEHDFEQVKLPIDMSWTPEETKRLIKAVRRNLYDWEAVAEELGGSRTPLECSVKAVEQFRERKLLAGEVRKKEGRRSVKNKRKRILLGPYPPQRWTEWEAQQLDHALKRYGSNISALCRATNRSVVQVKNRIRYEVMVGHRPATDPNLRIRRRYPAKGVPVEPPPIFGPQLPPHLVKEANEASIHYTKNPLTGVNIGPARRKRDPAGMTSIDMRYRA